MTSAEVRKGMANARAILNDMLVPYSTNLSVSCAARKAGDALDEMERALVSAAERRRCGNAVR